MSSVPFSYHKIQEGSYYQKSTSGFNQLSPNHSSYTNASTINSSQYYTYYPPMKSYMKEGNENRQLNPIDKKKTIPIDSFDSSKRSSSVYTYPYNYSNDYISFLQNEKKKKQEYNHYLKKQIEEKQKQKAMEYKRQMEEKTRDEERHKAYNQHLLNKPNQSITNYHNLAINNNTNDNGIRKISLNGRNVIDTHFNRNGSNGFNINSNFNNTNNNFISVYSHEGIINPIRMGGSVVSKHSGNNTIYMIDRTPRLPPPFQIDNCVNELIFSNCDDNNKNLVDLPVSLANIDFKALKYHSKYESCSNEIDKEKAEGGNLAEQFDIINKHSNREKGYNYNNRLNNNLKDDLKKSLKGNSTFVQADDSKGLKIADGFLKTWEKEENNLTKEETKTITDDTNHNSNLNPIYNQSNSKKMQDDKLQSGISNTKERNYKERKPFIPQMESLYKESKSYYNEKAKDLNNASKLIANSNNPIKLNDIHHDNGVSFNKQYNKAIDFRENIPLPIIDHDHHIHNICDTKNNTTALIDKYMSDLLKGVNSPLHLAKNHVSKEDYGYKPTFTREANCEDKSNKDIEQFNDCKGDFILKKHDDIRDNDGELCKDQKDLHQEKKDNKNSVGSVNRVQNELKMPLQNQFLSKQIPETKHDDELCNIRYDSESDNDNNNFLSKKSNGDEREINEEANNKNEEEITCNFLDDDNEDEFNIKTQTKDKNTNLQLSHNKTKEEGRDSKNETGKFQSQINYFDQSCNNESFAIKKSQYHKVNPEIVSFGNPIPFSSNKKSNVDPHTDHTFIITFKDVHSKMIPSQESSALTNDKKQSEESIDFRDSFTDKIIKEIGNFQLKKQIELNPQSSSSLKNSN